MTHGYYCHFVMIIIVMEVRFVFIGLEMYACILHLHDLSSLNKKNIEICENTKDKQVQKKKQKINNEIERINFSLIGLSKF